jgi:hypothetical protein
VASVVAAVAGVASLVVSLVSLQRPVLAQAPPTERLDAQLERATTDLATAILVQWRAEEQRRRINDPFALPVRWRRAPENLVDHWANIRATCVGNPDPGPLAADGRIDQILDIYRRIPSQRLVVLGRAGAGKTVLALRLVLDLLTSRTPGDPVPFVVAIGSWNPRSPLRDWLVTRLSHDHPGLTERTPAGQTLADVLFDTGRVLPILDGFDEIADSLHASALEALNATSTPLLLTSRLEEYAAAVKEIDVLTAAAVVILDDLTLEDLAGYLPRTTRKTITSDGEVATPWHGVLAHLTRQPADTASANLIAVLSTPLMLSLARAIYSEGRGRRDPAELLDPERFPTYAALESHLLVRQPGFVM